VVGRAADLLELEDREDRAEVVDTAVVYLVVRVHSQDRHSPWEPPELIPTMVIPEVAEVTLKR
jgi:hypothetical protein